jgi:DNA polymerase I
MNDVGLKGLGWVRLKDGNGVNTETVKSDKCIKASSVDPIEKLEDAPLKTMAFDIECAPLTPGTIPEASKDPVVLISLVFSEPFKGSSRMILSTRPGPGVTVVSSEKEILERFMDTINQFDPDIITGYNVNNFDFCYGAMQSETG